MIRRRCFTLALMLGCSFSGWGADIASPSTSLPDFDVTGIDGSTTHTAQIVRTGKWLLVFVRPNCPPCTSLLSALDASTTQDGSRIAVIVKTTTPNLLPALKAQYPNLPNATWYADVHAKAASSLMVPASPTTLGMKQGSIAWRLTGAISALPTGQLKTVPQSPDGKPVNPLVQQHALMNGWLTQP